MDVSTFFSPLFPTPHTAILLLLLLRSMWPSVAWPKQKKKLFKIVAYYFLLLLLLLLLRGGDGTELRCFAWAHESVVHLLLTRAAAAAAAAAG